MKKPVHIMMTLILMLIVSKFLVRIVDATVQLDGDIGMMALLLAVVNAAIGAGSYLVYRACKK